MPRMSWTSAEMWITLTQWSAVVTSTIDVSTVLKYFYLKKHSVWINPCQTHSLTIYCNWRRRKKNVCMTETNREKLSDCGIFHGLFFKHVCGCISVKLNREEKHPDTNNDDNNNNNWNMLPTKGIQDISCERMCMCVLLHLFTLVFFFFYLLVVRVSFRLQSE